MLSNSWFWLHESENKSTRLEPLNHGYYQAGYQRKPNLGIFPNENNKINLRNRSLKI